MATSLESWIEKLLQTPIVDFVASTWILKETDQKVNAQEIGDKAGLSEEQVQIIARFFLAERLVSVYWRDIPFEALKAGIRQKVDTVRITAKGIKEIEQVLKHPDKPTKYFSRPSVILNITGGTFNNSPFQVASRNSTQNLTIAPNNLAEVKQLLTELKEIQDNPNLGQETKEKLNANTKILHIQSKAEVPKRERIIGALSSIKSILEESSEVVSAAAPLATKIGSLLTGMG